MTCSTLNGFDKGEFSHVLNRKRFLEVFSIISLFTKRTLIETAAADQNTKIASMQVLHAAQCVVSVNTRLKFMHRCTRILVE